ncbi:MAG: hypothetical protein SGARI_006046 [Bacillariaceae sp.]
MDATKLTPVNEATILSSMALILQKIRREERASEKYRYGRRDVTASTASRRSVPQTQNSAVSSLSASCRRLPRETLSRRFAEQAALFILAYLLAWIFPMVQFAITNSPGGTLYYPLLALTVVLNPLQGLMNALIYFRPRYLRSKQRLGRRKQRQQRQELEAAQDQSQPAPEQPSELLESSTLSAHKWFARFRRVKNSSSEESRVKDDSSWRQALLSAVDVGGDDDEDDWEAQQGDVEEETTKAGTDAS